MLIFILTYKCFLSGAEVAEKNFSVPSSVRHARLHRLLQARIGYWIEDLLVNRKSVNTQNLDADPVIMVVEK